MTTEVQAQAGRCSTHGTVEATREVPQTGFPFVVYALRRALAQRRPYPLPRMRSSRPDRLTPSAGHRDIAARHGVGTQATAHR